MPNIDLWKWIGDTVNGVRDDFRKRREEKNKLISPIPDDMMMQSDSLPEFETVEPSARKHMRFEGEPEVTPTMQPTATPTPTEKPINSLDDFDTSQYQVSGDFEIQPLPDEISQQVQETFGKEAGRAAVVLGTENPEYDPLAEYDNGIGKNGQHKGIDTGLFQINTNTFNDFQRRKGKKMEEQGITSIDDLKDPIKNIKMAKIIFDEQGWNAWYGPRNKGYNVYDE